MRRQKAAGGRRKAAARTPCGRFGSSLFLFSAFCLLPSAFPRVLAHDGRPHGPADLLRTWGLDPLVLAGLGLSGWLYWRGVRRLWRSAEAGRGLRRWEAWCFAGGWAALFVALVSPLHPLGEVLFSAHMTQHEVLMLVAAPLLVLGRPVVAFLWALPVPWARRVGGWGRAGWFQGAWRGMTNPLAAWAVHAVALWVWHAPALFEATLSSDLVHTAQHVSFLGSALLFWWALVHGPRGLMGYGAAVLYLFTTSVHSGVLGALITFTRTVLYPAYAATTPQWGLTAIEDQQLGGLIMWVPAALVYIAAGLALCAGWMRESERRVLKREEQMRNAECGMMNEDKLPVIHHSSFRIHHFFFVAAVALACSGCGGGAERAAAEMTGGDVARGREKIRRYGCASCHTIPGIPEADSLVGPPLERVASRTYIAGVLTNSPEHMIRWIQDPPGVDPLTAMPRLGVGEQDARDIASYLYTLK
ncbi:MAG TPA: cytochrome c oxidase assembly protein [Pyrinomonadaceae bacterium]|nr:cytochrome c oxidase assembly protein [Pyrinomonadaceae bacterium]